MSFGQSTGFGGFGQANNQTTGGFGAFGATNNTNTGFGTSTSNTGFGSTSTSTNPFSTGGFGSTNTGGGFGTSTNTNTSLFGGQNKPAFGSTNTSAAPSLFGNSTNSNTGFGSGGGGFGSNTGTGFGASNNTGSAFSFGNQNKPAFGANTTGSVFGQGSSGTTGAFGSTNAFGSGSGTALNQAVPPSEGTGVTPFQPTNEKETNGGNISYQSISFQQPYQKYSFEELRLADYAAGRRYGNGSGQTGAFGATNFGGFGANNNTGFGTSNTNPFGGAATSSSTPFGNNTQTSGLGGGLFGNKPTNSIFGGATTQSTGTTSSGLFGTSNNTTASAFGGGTNTGFGGSNASSLFGGGQNQTQNKPGGLFGNNTSNTTSGFGGAFGNNTNTNTSSNPFGGSTGGGLFGNNNNTSSTSNQGGGLFGNNQTQNQQKPLFGSTFGTSTSQAQPSGGLFGNTTATNNTGGLFGQSNNNATQNQGGGLFGNSNTNNTGGGLFGNNNNSAAKPLFGSSNTTGGLFGNSQSQPATSGLFGNNNQQQNQQQQGSSLFGNNNNSGGSLFGNSNANKPAGLFGTTNSNTNQGSSLFGGINSTNNSGGLFGNSTNNQQTPQQPSSFHASVLDSNPYGQSSIWTGLPAATPQNSGPLATPLTASQRLKESQAKPPPSLRFTTSRYMTPPRRQGYGFTYSTYGTPNSAASTPGGGGLSTSMYGRGFTGGSFGRSVGKSFSATNLRQQFSADGESVLSPGAFAPGSSRYSSGSIRRLTIDRSLKTDLFSRPTQPALPAPTTTTEIPATNGENTSTEQPSKLKKRVSFDKGTTGGDTNGHLNGETGALVRTETNGDEPTEEDQGAPRSSRRSKNANGSSSSGPEMEQVRGNELAVVPEDRESDNVASEMRLPTDVHASPDPKPGEYWMKPSRAEISKMPREKLQRFRGFQVGRTGCGYVTFDDPVDLTAIPLDDVFEKLVEIRLRSITVYPEAREKPPRGKGLNVPSTLRIENSWPRSRNIPSSATSGPLYDKHLRRLKGMEGTEFINYDQATGVWTFRVPHFTRYGLDYDDGDEELDESALSSPPETPSEPSELPNSLQSDMDIDDGTPGESSQEDDTFAFKQKLVPGGFGRQSVVDFDQDQTFLGPRSTAANPGSEESEVSDQDESEVEMDMAGSFPQNDGAVEPTADILSEPLFTASQQPWGTPGKALIELDGDWADQLQRTISPRKQDREALREVQGKVLLDRAREPAKREQVSNKNEFRTSIDVMNSLFGKHEERMALSRMKETAGSGFEWPYAKRAKTFDTPQMEAADEAWHESMKPKWTPTGGLIYAQNGLPGQKADVWQDFRLLAGEGRVVVESTLKADDRDPFLEQASGWRQNVQITLADGVPFAKHKSVPFSTFCDELPQKKVGTIVTPGGEREVYQLAHILFDDYEDQFSIGLTAQQRKHFANRIRKDRLTDYWDVLVGRRHYKDITAAERRSPEEAALWYLTVHDITGACNCLMQAKDYHLATLVAQIDQADRGFQQDIAIQIEAWREQSIISELSEPIRALYEVLAGNTTISKGKNSGPPEDRASTFSISERFQFDWMQAFALCLWYGENKNGSIEDAVREFAEKLRLKEESAYPYPDEYVQTQHKGVEQFKDTKGVQESPLWVLLKLCAARPGSGQKPPMLPQALAPLTSPFNARVAFQLHHSLAAGISYIRVDKARADQLATDLAFQLSAAGFHVGAAYALMHLSDSSHREVALKDLLARHAAYLPEMVLSSDKGVPIDATSNSATAQWYILTLDLKIPAQWICEAKAQFARSQNESIDELNYLVAAELWSQAHTCLCRRVAPRAVIDEDWFLLAEVLNKFGDKPEERLADSWSAGGGIYADFVRLVAASKGKGKLNKTDENITGLVKRLQLALIEMGQRFKKRGSDLTTGGSDELEERVACKEMGRLVAEAIGKEPNVQKKMILDLPLSADARLSQTRDLSVSYYRAAMAAAK